MHWTQVVLAAALTLCVGAFIVIMVAVRRSTGANPRGHARGHGLAALVNGAAALLLVVIVVSYAVDARSVDRFGRIALLDHPVARGIGGAAVVLSGVCITWGELSLGRSFRVALPESKQPLVTHGIYRFTRNPLALSVDLLALGVLLLAPSWLALVSLLMNVVSYVWKIRIEEAYLREAHGAAYAAYCARTGRYLPRLFRDWGDEAMKADYGTYSFRWLSSGPFAGAILLGGLAFLPLPVWARAILSVLAALLALVGAYMIYMTRAFSDDELKKAVRDAMVARLLWDGQGRALDIGTGSGLVAIGLALKFPSAQVVGCDTWAGGFMGLTPSLCEGNAAAEGVADRVRFEEGNACRIPYADGEFDAVVSKDVFHAVREQKDKLALFREALRVLRPGGSFAFEDPYGITSIYRDLDGLIAALRADGLASLEFEWLDDLIDVPPLLRPIVGRPGILYGVK